MSNILLVDDEKSVRKTMQTFLQQKQYEVEVAAEADKAIQLLKDKSFDVAVVDIILPRVNGLEVLKQIQTLAPDVQVIIITGQPTVDTAAEAVRLGANEYLRKPINKEKLLKAVNHSVRLKQSEDERRRLQKENEKYQANLEKLVEQRTQELKQAMDDLRETQHQLVDQERQRALTQMASGIAHDFNNALSPIQSVVELLLEDPSYRQNQNELVHYLKHIQTSVNTATETVRRLRKFYRPRDKEEFVPLDLNNIIKEAVSVTEMKWKQEAQAAGKQVNIRTELNDASTIEGNEAELHEILTNLIFNAVEAMPEGGHIKISTHAENDSVVLLFSDNGVGMSEETLQKCLEPFYTTKGDDGNGLGLATLQGIVQRHNGSLSVDSTKGVGTTFRIVFPHCQATLNDSRDSEQLKKILPLNILLVEDHDCQRELLQEMLQKDGHSVDVAKDGVEGLELFYKGWYHVVITDRAMARMNGDQFAQKVKDKAPQKLVIMLTGFGDMMEANNEKPHAVDYLISKPANRDKLYSPLSQATEVITATPSSQTPTEENSNLT